MNEEELKTMDKEELLGVIQAQKFEINRLNNIINELEKYISDYKNVNTIQGCEVFYKDELLNKLKALKEDNKDV